MRTLAMGCLAATVGCGPGLVDADWPGAPLITLEARLDVPADVPIEGDVQVALQWFAKPVDALSTVVEPPEPMQCDGQPVPLFEQSQVIDETEWVSETQTFEPEFPLRMRIPVFEPPPETVQGDLLDLGGEGRWAIGQLVAFADLDGSGRFEPPTPGGARDRVLGLARTAEGRTRRVLFLDGTLPDGHALAGLAPGLHVMSADPEQPLDIRPSDDGEIALGLPAGQVARGDALLTICGRTELRVRLGGPATPGDPVECAAGGDRFVAGQVEYEPGGTPCVVEQRWTAACLTPGATRPAGWPCT